MQALTQAQVAYYFEQGQFATVIEELGLGSPDETENFQYTIVDVMETGAIAPDTAKVEHIKSDTNGVFVLGENQNFGMIVCETLEPSRMPLNPPVVEGATASGALRSVEVGE